MKPETRRVYAFIGAGLLTAASIGIGVWRAGDPMTPSASDTATVTPEVSTISESVNSSLITPTSESQEKSLQSLEATEAAEAVAQAITPPRTDDPFLAPHAIVQPVPNTITPTTVYRPENLRPTAAPQATPGSATVEPTETGRPSQPVEPTETERPSQPVEPTETERPSQPVEPTETGRPSQPVETATPGEPAAPESSPASQSPGPPGESADEVAANGQPQSVTQPESGEPQQPGQGAPQPTPPHETTGAQTPESDRTAITPPRPGWWILGRWFPASS